MPKAPPGANVGRLPLKKLVSGQKVARPSRRAKFAKMLGFPRADFFDSANCGGRTRSASGASKWGDIGRSACGARNNCEIAEQAPLPIPLHEPIDEAWRQAIQPAEQPAAKVGDDLVLPTLDGRTVARATSAAGTRGCVGQGVLRPWPIECSKKSLSVLPGLTTSTSTPIFDSSARIDSLSPMSANFEAQYSLLRGVARCPSIEATLTTIGRSPCFSSGSATRMNSAAAKKFTSKIFRN